MIVILTEGKKKIAHPEYNSIKSHHPLKEMLYPPLNFRWFQPQLIVVYKENIYIHGTPAN